MLGHEGKTVREAEPQGGGSLGAQQPWGAEAALQISCEKELNFFVLKPHYALGALSHTPAEFDDLKVPSGLC